MSLQELEAEISRLPREELDTLALRIEEIRQQYPAPTVCTGADAIKFWSEMEHLTPEEADAFAADVEEGRRLMNQPPQVREWD
jgi:hypothetical protein